MQYTQRMQSSIKKHYFCNASIVFINNKFHFNIKKKHLANHMTKTNKSLVLIIIVLLFLLAVLIIVMRNERETNQSKQIKTEQTIEQTTSSNKNEPQKPSATNEKTTNNTHHYDPTLQIDAIEIPLITATDEIIRHAGFTLSYCERHEQARWVAYKLSAEQLNGTATRTNRFMSDPKVKQESASDDDYKHSGFDRGHLAPAADMKWSDEAMRSSFYFSNMSPQKRGFNAGVWKRAEELVRTWANSYQQIYVVTGPVLHHSLEYIGTNKVSVPRLFYKVILTGDSQRALGFVIPHENSKMHLSQFAVSVDSVERLTGIDFFHHLPDELENKVENMTEF